MKKLYSIFVLFFLIISCGGGSSSDSVDVNASETDDVTDFSGSYSYVDDDCSGIFVDAGFTVSQSGTSVTVTTATGDQYSGMVGIVDDQYAFEVEDTACVFGFVRNTSDIDILSDGAPTVSFEIGDLVAICEDASSDGLCAIAYE